VAPGGRLLITIPDGTQDTWVGHTNFWSADAFARFLQPLPVGTVRRLDEGRVLMFEIVRPSEAAAIPPRRWGSLRARLGGWLRAWLRRRGWDLIRYRPRPTYLQELNRYTSQILHADLWVKPSSVVLDLGSGHYPFPHATILSDLHIGPTRHRTEDLVQDGRPLVVFDIHRMPFRDQSVDFVYCSHVLEHVEDPARACAELIRVGREGYIETPTVGKDLLFAWGEGRHRWHVVAVGNRLAFFEYTSRQLEGIRSAAWRDLIFGEAYHPLQEAFYGNQDIFNVMFRWRGRFDWVVYRLNGSVEASDGLRSPSEPD
jgi:SAM-dependent methyltransferase